MCGICAYLSDVVVVYMVWLQVIGDLLQSTLDSKVHGANMGPVWDRQDPGGPHGGPMNLAIWDVYLQYCWSVDNWPPSTVGLLLESIQKKYATLNIAELNLTEVSCIVPSAVVVYLKPIPDSLTPGRWWCCLTWWLQSGVPRRVSAVDEGHPGEDWQDKLRCHSPGSDI